MFHVELRQFPHNFCRFNLDEAELRRELLEPWVRGEIVELGERRWDPRQASLTVLDGGRLALSQLAMGRGWRNAQRGGADVTEAVLARARRTLDRGTGETTGTPAGGASPSATAPPGSPANAAIGAGAKGGEAERLALAGELLGLLGDDPVPLVRAWQLALERHPDRAPSECLALAEEFLRG